MDLSAQPVWMSLPLFEKAMCFLLLCYPVLGIAMARRRLASGEGSVVALATLPLTAGAVVFWIGLPSVADGLRIFGDSKPLVDGFGAAAEPLFVACLSTLLVLAGILLFPPGDEERRRSTRLTLLVNGAPFAVAAAGFVYGFVLRQLFAPPSSLTALVLGAALIGLHLLVTALRLPPESRATAAAVFVLTAVLAVAVWQFSQRFRVVVD